MGPVSEADGSDGLWQGGEVVPCGACGFDDVFDAAEHGVGQPVGAQELPDILDRVQFGRAGRQEDQADVARQSEFGCCMPAGAIEQNDGMRSACDAA